MDSKITAHVQVRKTRSLPDGSECAKGARRQTGDRRPGFIVNYKFQNLDVYKLALDYLDEIYEIVGRLPDSEKFNLNSQIVRAARRLSFRKTLAIPVPDPRSPVKEVPVASPWSPVREKQ